MKPKIKIGETEFEIIFPKIEDIENEISVSKHLKEWCKLVEESEFGKREGLDFLYELPRIPGHSFKNIKLEPSFLDSGDSTEATITVKFDEFKKID